MEMEVECTKDILRAAACDYDMGAAEYFDALEAVLGNEDCFAHLSQEAIAFVCDIQIWRASERISPCIMQEAVRRIYEEC